ncbi:hypothetical protein J3F84DRAFT_354411 [Trichoderma pleuroticola]|uniref:Uncharacterized protein n=1 Tax=Trichoderma harzianum TaxID=5544 RepID=A0A2K0UBX5_TRIHA|nr:hypothetical protein THARTR1_04427 [Trichoderma harzianum]
MGRTIKALRQPFTTIRQVWKDYQVGRAIRHRTFKDDPKEEECEERCDEECQVACKEEGNETCKENDKEKCKEEHEDHRNEECNKESEEECSDSNEDQCKDDEVPLQVATCRTEEEERAAQYAAQTKRKWKWDTNAEFPWRHEQVVDEESNWRGTWVLEVKDLNAMKWATEIVFTRTGDKRERTIVRKPTRQLPFPIGQERLYLPTEGGQRSDILPYEGGQDGLMVWLGKS